MQALRSLRPNRHPKRIWCIGRLEQKSVIPNRDFLLRYAPAGEGVQDSLLVENGAEGGYFALVLQPPTTLTTEDVRPKALRLRAR